jgi:hypothetical protein
LSPDRAFLSRFPSVTTVSQYEDVSATWTFTEAQTPRGLSRAGGRDAQPESWAFARKAPEAASGGRGGAATVSFLHFLWAAGLPVPEAWHRHLGRLNAASPQGAGGCWAGQGGGLCQVWERGRCLFLPAVCIFPCHFSHLLPGTSNSPSPPPFFFFF